MGNLFKAMKFSSWPWPLMFLALTLLFSLWMPPDSISRHFSPTDQGIVEEKTRQGFPYMLGGVSAEEREQMAMDGADYNLKLVFANARGDYLDGVNLVIQDEKGKEIVSLTTGGPWFYIDLPAGKYSVEASIDGMTKREEDIRVGTGGQVVRLLEWTSNADSIKD